MKVVFIARSSLYMSKGGDTIQIQQTAKYLQQLNTMVDIRLANEKINYREYDLLHFFNLTRPSDILPHINRSKKPFVVTPLLIDYSEYDKQYRKGLAGKIFRQISSGQIEYAKTMARWIKRQQPLGSFSYLFQGHTKSIKHIIKNAEMILPNSEMEYRSLVQTYSLSPSYSVIPNGIDDNLFAASVNARLNDTVGQEQKDKNMILCVARIEGLKNQINLISALNHSRFKLFLIGNAALNQTNYYIQCKKKAADNIHFIDHLPQEELINYYQKAKVHVLPSWFETCGLSTLEAGACGCNVVITDRGYASEYCNGNAFYCDPSSPSSIREAIEKASESHVLSWFREKIIKEYTWRNAAGKTYEAYQKIIKE